MGNANLVKQLTAPGTLGGQVNEIARGIPASPGAAVGEVVFDSKKAYEASKSGRKVILVRRETSPDDLGGMVAAQGILTSRGGKTSHAAVVARGWGTPAVVGADAVQIDGKMFRAGDVVVREGDVISLDGTTGEVMLGAMQLTAAEPTKEFQTILKWAADQEMKPPVALLAYVPDNPKRSVFYPFAEFSPEWQAIRHGLQHSVPVHNKKRH